MDILNDETPIHSYMIEMSINEVKQIEQDVLFSVAQFCDKNQINYWLDCGTLLGAIRHKGFIPWDDDIDIGMFRDDYNRFISLFKEDSQGLNIQCIEFCKAYYNAYAKVVSPNTVVFEDGYQHGIGIDVFPYDNAPEDRIELEKAYKRRDHYNRLNKLRHSKGKIQGKIYRRVIDYIYRALLKCFPQNYFAKRISCNAQKYNKKNYNNVGNFTSLSRICCPKSIFSSFINCTFEGISYKCPVGYDQWLRAFYGEYMQLPPEEKRVNTHTFRAYKISSETDGKITN